MLRFLQLLSHYSGFRCLRRKGSAAGLNPLMAHRCFYSLIRFPTLPSTILLPLLFNTVAGLTAQYCSILNTSEDGTLFSDIYQSNGACTKYCRPEYAFAILQGSSCWCSDYAPMEFTSVGSCDEPCPGYPADKCGSKASNLYSYFALERRPSGTIGISDPVIVEPTAASPPPPPAPPPPVVTLPEETPSMPLSESSSSESTSSGSTSWTKVPSTTVEVVTVSGAVVTQTIVSIQSLRAEAASDDPRPVVAPEVIAGSVVGGVVGLLLVMGFVVWLFWFRRRHAGDQFASDGLGGSSRGSPRRTTSMVSKTGLLSTPEKAYHLSAVAGRRGSGFGIDIPTSPTAFGEQQNSRPVVCDQRLNPYAVMMELDNGSSLSIGTIQDNRDYTRTLNVRNPDPP